MNQQSIRKHLMAAGLLAFGATVAHADIASSFDNGLEGWTGAGGALSFAASGGSTGGVGGGHLRQLDTLNTWMSVNAPSSFLGNLLSYLGGSLSFDARNVSNHASDLQSGPWFGRVTITGSAGSASRDFAGSGAGLPLRDGLWHTYSATLDPASWSGNLAAALADTTAITLSLELNNAIVETAGLDNFSIAAVPEPSTMLLLGAGVLVLFGSTRRLKA